MQVDAMICVEFKKPSKRRIYLTITTLQHRNKISYYFSFLKSISTVGYKRRKNKLFWIQYYLHVSVL